MDMQYIVFRYEMMTSCWKNDPDSRPSFVELIPVLDRQVEQTSVRISLVWFEIFKKFMYQIVFKCVVCKVNI